MPPRKSNLARRPQSRVFLIENGAGPGNAPEYMGLARAGALSWSQGDVTPIRGPSDLSYDEFEIVDQIRGQQGLPALPIMFRRERILSDVLRIATSSCPADLQIHWGACKDPTDFNNGWEVVDVLERAYATSYDTDELGAFDRDEDGVVGETVPFTGRDYYQIARMVPSEVAGTEITDEVIDVTYCDKISCGECGIESDGAQVAFALINDTSGSPGLPAEVVYTANGFATVGSRAISVLGLSQSPTAFACVGQYLVVVSNTADVLAYIPITNLLAGTGSWSSVATGIVAAGSINDLFSLGRTNSWFVGDGGYVYRSEDITGGVTVQSAGTVTTQVLNAIHGIDKNNLVAVGAANAVIVTHNGGDTWSLITGPLAATVLNTVFMVSDLVWWIGTATGRMFYTRDGGATWTEKTFSGSGTGQVRDIVFATGSVGYMAHDTTAPLGRVFRTIDGGASWYPLPEDTGLTFPDNDRITTLAVPTGAKSTVGANQVLAGGLAGTGGNDGILVRVQGG